MNADANERTVGGHHPPALDPAATGGTSLARWLTPTAAVLWAAVAYAVLALITVGLDRQVRWDEVTYLAQVTPGALDVWFGPQRARGMTLVLAPVGLAGGGTTLLRVWLIGVHAGALFVAFRPWARELGWGAAAAAWVVAFGWIPLYFAVEGYPNLLAGFLGVAMIGSVVSWLRQQRDRDLVLAALALAAVAMLRPTESVWLAAGATLVVVVAVRLQAWRPIVAFLTGGFVGWLPWLIEAIVRFGGPFARLEAARATSAAGADRNSLIQYLNLIEGPVRRVVSDPVLTGPALALLVGLVVLAVIGIVHRTDRTRKVALWAAAVTSIVMVVPYLVLNAGINLRYILPGLLLAAIPVGAGLAALLRTLFTTARRTTPARQTPERASVQGHERRRRRSDPHPVSRARALTAGALGVLMVAVLAVTAGWQLQLASHNAEAIAPLQARPVPLGEALAQAADGEPCAFLSNVQWPEIQWHSGCAGEVLHFDAPLLQCHDARRDLAALAESGARIFVLARGEPPFSPAVDGWPVTQLDEPEGGVWRLYERPAELGPSDPPTIPAAQDSPTPCPPSRAPDTTDAKLELRWSRDGT